ncbi:YczE/YyaS/YitT family protein [Bilifractor sp. HCP3S3_D3]|uniref:YczE/YyaS/YitT family protein n=1 Tax=unclassified Bilifractor TaxID=2815795 RepID=UPI003F8B9B99
MKEFPRRVLMAVIGVCVAGLSVGMFVYSDMGVDPFQVFAHGTWNAVRRAVPLDFGTYYAILNAILLVVIFFWNRRKIGIGTVINLFLVGYFAEFMEFLLNKMNPDPNLALRIISLILGVVIMCFASAMYFTADLGVSTYDAVAITLSERHTGWKFKYIRILTDLICVVIGGLLGGVIGIGTLVTAFFMGPLIAFFNKKVAEPMRYGSR